MVIHERANFRSSREPANDQVWAHSADAAQIEFAYLLSESADTHDA